jgi:hypothetical protein
MRYASLLSLSLLLLACWTLIDSQTKASAATEYRKPAMNGTSKVPAIADTVTFLEKGASGSLPQSRMQTGEVVAVSIPSTANPQGAKTLTPEELEYWSTIDLIEK